MAKFVHPKDMAEFIGEQEGEGRGEEAIEGVNVRSEFEKAVIWKYVETGNAAETARGFGMTLYELGKMQKQLWWVEEVNAIKVAEKAATDARLTKILNRSLEKLELMLEEGEEVVTGKGDVVTRQLDGRTLISAIDVIFDKRQLVRDLPTNINPEGKKLKELADKLEELSRFQKAREIKG